VKNAHLKRELDGKKMEFWKTNVYRGDAERMGDYNMLRVAAPQTGTVTEFETEKQKLGHGYRAGFAEIEKKIIKERETA
jgi:hypothetical protein